MRNIIDKLIDFIPIEFHLPDYNYTGPGTKLLKRLERGDKPINKLDAASKEHDLIYHKSKDSKKRFEADKVLIEQAEEIYQNPESSFREKIEAYVVKIIMKTKTKLGRILSFKNIIRKTAGSLKCFRKKKQRR